MRRVLFFIVAAYSLRAADVPMALVSEDEGEPIRSAIIRKEGWTQDAARHLRAEAEKRLREGPWSVTFDRPRDTDLDLHEYYSEAPYWWPNPLGPGSPYVRRDGQINPARFNANRAALNSMCDAVFTLGAAAFFLEDKAYAQRAARVIHVWFVNPRTRMNPGLDYAQVIPGVDGGRVSGIIETRGLIRAIQGMEFLFQAGGWDPREQAAVHRWFYEYLRWLTTSRSGLEARGSGNIQASWWTAQVAAVAAFVDNPAMRQKAFNYYRERILPRQIRPNGSAPREEARSRSLLYSALNLEAYTIVCRIAQVHGVDLWNVRARNGATIAAVINYLEPYLADPRKWTREQLGDFQNDGPYFLAFAGMGLKRPEYVALFRKLERADNAWLTVVDLLVSRWEGAAHQTRH